MVIEPLAISAYTTVNALGNGTAALLKALRAECGGLRPCDFLDVDLATWIGRVAGLEEAPLTPELQRFECRNHRLAQLALRQDHFQDAVTRARARYGAERLGVFVGSSTSGILSTELAYRQRDPVSGALPADFDYEHTHDIFALAAFVRAYLALRGPALCISTACSSSAKAFASAWRYIATGLCDAAVVGGADSLCLTTLYGFHSLALTAEQPCRPWDAARNGLSIGEAASFFLLERMATPTTATLALRGYGESSDAYHMSAVHPEGEGAYLAMAAALQRAGLRPQDIDYINLHGTATPANDSAEDRAVMRLFGAATACSSTKGWSGHALGAAGALEAAIACLGIEHGVLPGTLNTVTVDPALGVNLRLRTEAKSICTVLSNSFGFGGSNCSLIFGAL